MSPITLFKLTLAAGSFALVKKRPHSRLLIAIPLIQAGLSLAKARENQKSIEKRRRYHFLEDGF